MSEVLLIGTTHFPMFSMPDENWGTLFDRLRSDPSVPEKYRDPMNWPPELRRQWSDDRGLAAASAHRAELIDEFRRIREELAAFDPDYVVIWGDDQYENFQDDAIPPFSILAYEDQRVFPWRDKDGNAIPNAWGEPGDFAYDVRMARPQAKKLTSRLIADGFDTTYAYRPLHKQLGHAFLNTVLFLDYDRQGFPWPVVPFHLNCYGSRVVVQKGAPVGLSGDPAVEDLDPPSPSPWRFFDLGAACVRAAAGDRVAFIASSSWSHAFLTRKNYFLWPDIEADRTLYDSLLAQDYDPWRNRTLEEIEDSGQQELLNWVCLAGAMAELGAVPKYANFHECWVFNSPKVGLVTEPVESSRIQETAHRGRERVSK